MKTRLLWLMNILSILALTACDGHHHDPLKDHEDLKDYVPVYDREVDEQYYLPKDSLVLNAPDQVSVREKELKTLNLSFENNMDGLVIEGMKVVSAPEWVEQVETQKGLQLKILLPENYSWSSEKLPMIHIRLMVGADSTDDAKILTKFYETERKIKILDPSKVLLGGQ